MEKPEIHQDNLKIIFDNALEGIVVAGIKDRKIRMINHFMTELLGRPADELMGKKIDVMHPKEEMKFVLEKFDDLASGKIKIAESVPLIKSNKEIIYCDIASSVAVFDGGPYLVGFFRDVTEKKAIEKKLQKNEAALSLNYQRMKTLLDLNQMTDATLSQITDFALEAAVRLTESKIGYLAFLNEDETILTMHSWSRQAMKQCAIINKPINYVVKDTGLWGEAVRQRKPVITNNYNASNPLKKGYPAGHVQISRHMNVPIFVGKHIVLVAGVGNKDADYNDQDVQQLTLLMEGMWRLIERMRAEEIIKIEKEKLEKYLSIAEVIIVAINTNANVTLINRKGCQLLGRDEKDIIGENWFKICLPSEEYKTTFAVFNNIISGKIKSLEYYENNIISKTGEKRLIAWHNTILKDKSGAIIGTLSTGEDITERKKTEDDLKKRAKELEKINRLLVGRENAMVELKKEVASLKKQKNV